MPNAIGVDLNYPGYDGTHLPFASESQDAVYSSHCLEHISDARASLFDWFRVLKTGGFLIVVVPHYQLYDKAFSFPTFYNNDHKRLYHPGLLLNELHQALPVGSWRLRHCRDNDEGFDYNLPVNAHSVGCYEIECVIEKIAQPMYIKQMLALEAGKREKESARITF